MSHTENLKTVYDAIAPSFSRTRQKHWPEFDWIYDIINKKIEGNKEEKKILTIIEVWCGDGRLYRLLRENWISCHYTWVDISENLLAIGREEEKKREEKMKNNEKKEKKKNETESTATFICQSMTEFLATQETMSCDMIIWVATVQHLDKKQRKDFFAQAYRVLQYEGDLIMTNRSYSQRFLKKYQKNILSSLFFHIITLWRKDLHNLSIAYTYEWVIYKRFYHIFRLSALRALLENAGFVIQTLTFMGQKWKITDKRQHSRNSICHCVKSIFSSKFA